MFEAMTRAGSPLDDLLTTVSSLEQQRDQLLAAEELAGIGSWSRTRTSDFLTVSPNYARLYGLETCTELPLSTLVERIHADDRERLAAALEQFWNDGQDVKLIYRVVFLSGELRFMEARIQLPPGAEVGTQARGTVRDVTESERHSEERRFQAFLLRHIDASVIASDRSGRVIHWDEESEGLYGFTAQEALGRHVSEVIGAAQTPPEMRPALRSVGAWHGEITITRPDGTISPRYLRVSEFHDAAGNVTGHVGVSVDIAAQVAAQESATAALSHMRAVTDSMGEGMLTIDAEGRVTYMNSAAEHQLGWREDEIMGQIAHNVFNHTHADGRPYPLETCPLDQFLAAAPEEDGEVLRDEEDCFIRKDGSSFPVSYAATRLRDDNTTTGAVVVFRDITARKAEEARLANRLAEMEVLQEVRDALAEDRFELHGQPIIDLKTDQIVQHELLIRMRDRDGRLVPPCEFLPVAEEHGLIVEIDRWVIGQAALYAAHGQAIEINLSAESIGDERTCTFIKAAFEAVGADPSLLVVEVTETSLVQQMGIAAKVIGDLGQLGCDVALDDFGTGHAGFSYLKQLPFDYLKIDIEFVRDLPHDTASRHVVQAVVDLARNFGYRTVAEGVETQAALDTLRELGVHYAQGFYLGRPAPLQD